MSVIPTVHKFECAVRPEDTLKVDVASKNMVMFVTNEDAICITEHYQIQLIRDMLTAWLSRPAK